MKWFYLLLAYFPSLGLIRFLVSLEKPSLLVRFFIKIYFVKFLKVNLAEIEKPLDHYASVLAFFTRGLKTGIRKIDVNPKNIVSPVDAQVLQYGTIQSHTLIQAKGRKYSLETLVGTRTASRYRNGSYLTLYLSPKDYHRIHHPASGKIDEVLYFPGTVFPVNSFSLHHFDQVFSRNKRLIVSYQTEFMSFLACWIGALNVGELKVSFDPEFYTSAKKTKDSSTEKSYYQKSYHHKVTRGDLAGCFELGSTVILIFPEGKVDFVFRNPSVLLGEPVARANISG